MMMWSALNTLQSYLLRKALGVPFTYNLPQQQGSTVYLKSTAFVVNVDGSSSADSPRALAFKTQKHASLRCSYCRGCELHFKSIRDACTTPCSPSSGAYISCTTPAMTSEFGWMESSSYSLGNKELCNGLHFLPNKIEVVWSRRDKCMGVDRFGCAKGGLHLTICPLPPQKQSDCCSVGQIVERYTTVFMALAVLFPSQIVG